MYKKWLTNDDFFGARSGGSRQAESRTADRLQLKKRRLGIAVLLSAAEAH